ncbi:MAG TPA: hypothetical protein EYP30_01120 [Archaeoglobaceae archaeon]|nr:hypothetical protein [Archaeoglobaceae archaeon]
MKYIYCETCEDYTQHRVINKKNNLYRCVECSDISHYIPEKEVKVRAIISSGEESEKGFIKLKESEIINLKDELVIETDEGFKIGQVTSIELDSGKRVDRAEVNDVSTLWLRNIGEVPIRISIHEGRITEPFVITVTGETEFEIDEVLEITNKKCRITKIKLDNGKLLDKAGQKAKSKEIKRIYAVAESGKRKRKRKKKR